MNDTQKKTMTDGSPVTPDHRELKEDGQQKGYVVLSEEERAKGFVRPVRQSYVHVGIPIPEVPLVELTDEQKERYGDSFVKFEKEQDPDSPRIGKFWTQEEVDQIDNGCRVTTTMGVALAETYARDPKFYGGTFCAGCSEHFPVKEFLWSDTDEQVGS